MFQYIDEDGNFIIESGSNAVPIMKVSGSVVYISGSIIPFESADSAFSEIGTLAKPFKELYVESASINFVDTSKAINHAERRVKFSKVDVDNLKAGRPINEDGVVSASGDMHVVGNSKFVGVSEFHGLTKLKGRNEVTGALSIRGEMDVQGNFKVNGTGISNLAESLAYSDSLRGTGVTANEFNILDGVTSTAAELNILDGVTSTAAELNILDGVTSTAAELNILDGVTSTAAELNKLDGFTGDKDDLIYAKDLKATGVTADEFNILDGVTSTAAELNILDGVTSTAAELNILDGVTSTTAELNIMDGVTATAAELNKLDGVTATTAELNYTDGVTSAIQTQLNAKATTAGVVGDLLPDADGTRDLGSTSKEWQDLHIDGTANLDAAVIGEATLSNTKMTGQIHINTSPTAISANGLLDARSQNHFTIGNLINVTGIRGSGNKGQIVTIVALGANRVTIHHAENGVHANDRFVFEANRDLSLRGPAAMQVIYAGQGVGWYRLL